MGHDVIGRIPGRLFGGPLDGTRYGDLPDTGQPYTNAVLSVPLTQPADESAHAVYRCQGAAPVNGWWQFFYQRTDRPGAVETPCGTQVHFFAPKQDATPPAIETEGRA